MPLNRKDSRRSPAGSVAVALFVAGLLLPSGAGLNAAGPRTATVPAGGADLSFLRHAAADALAAGVSHPGARVEIVDLVAPPAATDAPPGTVLHLEPPAGWERSSRVTLPVSFTGGDGRMRRVYLSVRVQLMAAVPVAGRGLQRLDRLTAGDTEFQEHDLLALRGRRPLEADLLTGDLRLRRAVAAGSVLTEDLVERTPVVTRGQRIALLVQSGSLTVRTTGIARKSGAPGDVIPVANADTGRIIEARVRDARTALVENF